MWPTKSQYDLQAIAQTGRRLHAVLVETLALIRPGTPLGEIRRLTEHALTRAGFDETPQHNGSRVELRCGAVTSGSSPDRHRLVSGQFLTLDLFARFQGWWADCARTVPVGRISLEQGRLLSIARHAQRRGIAAVATANCWNDVRREVEAALAATSLQLSPDLHGHAIGRELHESPFLPWTDADEASPDVPLTPGFAFTLEPTLISREFPAASEVVQNEDTLAITEHGPRILTSPGIPHSDRNVVLIGMPGAGKSSVGKEFAWQTNRDFIDLDDVIQAQEGRTLRQLIEAHGFDDFLEIEATHARGLTGRRSVIATGGSVVYRPDAMESLASQGEIVLLDVPPTDLEARLSDLRQRGVVIEPGRTITDLWNERTPLYRAWADLTVNTPGQTVPEIAAHLAAQLLS